MHNKFLLLEESIDRLIIIHACLVKVYAAEQQQQQQQNNNIYAFALKAEYSEEGQNQAKHIGKESKESDHVTVCVLYSSTLIIHPQG